MVNPVCKAFTTGNHSFYANFKSENISKDDLLIVELLITV